MPQRILLIGGNSGIGAALREKREAAAARHPARRIGRDADPAAAARFLLSDESNWITGQVLAVDGGMSSLRMM